MDDQIARIAAGILAQRGAQAYAGGDRREVSWREDYGPGRKAPPGMEPQRLPAVSGRPSAHRGSGSRQGAVVSRSRLLWAQMMTTRPGTKVFAGCLAIASFIFMA